MDLGEARAAGKPWVRERTANIRVDGIAGMPVAGLGSLPQAAAPSIRRPTQLPGRGPRPRASALVGERQPRSTVPTKERARSSGEGGLGGPAARPT